MATNMSLKDCLAVAILILGLFAIVAWICAVCIFGLLQSEVHQSGIIKNGSRKAVSVVNTKTSSDPTLGTAFPLFVNHDAQVNEEQPQTTASTVQSTSVNIEASSTNSPKTSLKPDEGPAKTKKTTLTPTAEPLPAS